MDVDCDLTLDEVASASGARAQIPATGTVAADPSQLVSFGLAARDFPGADRLLSCLPAECYAGLSFRISQSPRSRVSVREQFDFSSS